MRIALCALRQPLDHLVVNLLMREHARTRRADLPGVEEDPGRRRLGRGLDIGVVEDDVGGLAAEFERHAFEIARRAAQDSAADAGRSRERHLVDVGMIDQGVADHAAGTGDDIEHARRQAGFERQLADPQCRERRQLGRLHHDGAAAGQRRRKFPHPDHQREIPGHDDGDHADRLAYRVGERIIPRGNDLAADLVGPARVVGQRVDCSRQVLPQHACDRLAGIEAFERCDFIGVLFHQVDEPEQDLSRARRAHGAPGAFESASRRGDRAVDVGFVAFRDRGDDLLGGRVEGLEGASGGRRNVLAVDQQQPRLCRPKPGA